MTATALAAVLAVCPPMHAIEADELAAAVVAACSGPVAEPSGEECVGLVVAVMAVESGCQLYPRRRGTGAGPMQLCQPHRCYGSARIGRVCVSPHEYDGAAGVRWGTEILRWKRRAWTTWRAALEGYNGSPGRRAYAARVLAIWKKTR